MSLFALKKLVSLFLHPLPILIGLMFVGLLLYFRGRREPGESDEQAAWNRDNMDVSERRRRRRRRLGVFGIVTVWLSLVLLYLLGLAPVSKAIVRPLEEAYPILDPASLAGQGVAPAHIVVLGGGYQRTTGYPVTSRLSSHSQVRLNEGIRLYRSLPDSILLFSGGDQVEGEDQRSTVADGMAELAGLMGVDDEQIRVERDSRDTREHPLKIQPLLGEERRIILVTSAIHMTRAVRLFEKHGYEVVAAPAGVGPSDSRFWHLGDFIPDAGSYTRIDQAVHEYLGLLWARLRGQID